jgi:hypothetical protein
MSSETRFKFIFLVYFHFLSLILLKQLDYSLSILRGQSPNQLSPQKSRAFNPIVNYKYTYQCKQSTKPFVFCITLYDIKPIGCAVVASNIMNSCIGWGWAWHQYFVKIPLLNVICQNLTSCHKWNLLTVLLHTIINLLYVTGNCQLQVICQS